jgi:two-component system OmpR family response regulator
MSKKERKVKLFSALEVANLCGVVNQTVINWIKQGFIKAFMTPGGQYRVYPEDLAEFFTNKNMKIPPVLLQTLDEKISIRDVMIIGLNSEACENLRRLVYDYDQTMVILMPKSMFEAGKMLVEHKPRLVLVLSNPEDPSYKEHIESLHNDAIFEYPFILVVRAEQCIDTDETLIQAGANAVLVWPVEKMAFADAILGLQRASSPTNTEVLA